MSAFLKHKKGFTLIEILVVIAIIALLASIIFANLQHARKRAKDAALIEQTSELAKLAELNYHDYATYTNLQRLPIVAGPEPERFLGWIPAEFSCDKLNNGTYGPNAVTICEEILKNSPGIPVAVGTGIGKLYVGLIPVWPFNSQKYSFLVVLNEVNSTGKNYVYCAGNSGARGTYPSPFPPYGFPIYYYNECPPQILEGP